MFGIKLTDYDRSVYRDRLADFLPDKIIDMHVHIWKKEYRPAGGARGCVTWTRRVSEECDADDLARTYAELFPEKRTAPILMGHPAADLVKTNAFTRAEAEAHNLPAMFCTSFDTPSEEIRNALTTGGFVGIKPYLNNSPAYIPPSELRIFDFLPHEHLRIADELGAVVILHISRPGRLRDEVNLAQLMEIDRLYGNAKVIVAHVGRAYVRGDLGNAFDILKKSKNLYFDFSANTLDLAMKECLAAVGPERVMFGTDMPITKMRMYRIEEDGIYKNVVPRGLYGDVSQDKNMKETDESDITFFVYEELLAFRRAAEELGLSRNDINDVFYNNASRIFNFKFQEK